MLRDIDLEIPLGTVFTILGPSGSGKTSLLRLINRLTDPQSGEILFAGKPLQSFEPTQLRRRIGYIFQVPTMLPGTVADNLAYGANLGQSGRHLLPDRAEMLRRLRDVALDETYLNRSAERLSVGEQQRVSIARSLMTSPEVLLMDEPTSALDPAATTRLLALITKLHERHGLTIVFVTHQLEQARAVGEQTAILIEGRIVETGTTAEVFSSPRQPETRRFLEGRLGEETESEEQEESQ
ncbi:hypothetical protein AMJ85_07620 [candidate division BRC1 bacterium SM23_51]|nr:MAG: hypothetical protein AMJ85_07620 [candidate division BRC1 bacterium SM23_51]